jgi:hypothetical protein
MNSSVIYQIVRYGVPSSAGHFRPSGEFVQVFPYKRVFRDKAQWASAWHIFGDEVIMTYIRRPNTTPGYPR